MKASEIILHHSLTKDSGTVSWQAIRRYHVSLGWINIGYHYGIELVNNSYEVLVGRMLNEDGAHTIGHNSKAIGICFTGNFDVDEVPIQQWELGISLVGSLCMVFGISPSSVYGHRDFANKSCPGNKFNLALFRDQVLDYVGYRNA